ncbi:MAG TPA: glycosidase, partial [bacterium]|nr:glycosidase [bacterium]
KNHWQKYLSRLEEFTVLRPKFDWESKKIGGGPPPIKTAKGWLLIYHGVDDNLVYRAGAALLDLDNPQKVIARSPVPILEPEREYELTGDVPNVVFPEGTAVFDDTLYVYYGGADKVIGLATINLPEFIDELTTYKA